VDTKRAIAAWRSEDLLEALLPYIRTNNKNIFGI
jgi:hypothetical protein